MKTSLKVLLGIGMAIICVGLVAVPSGGETGCQQIQTTVNKIDTEEEVISVATRWMKETGHYRLIADTVVVETSYLGVGDYGEAWIVRFCRGYVPEVDMGVDCIMVGVELNDGVVTRCRLLLSAHPNR